MRVEGVASCHPEALLFRIPVLREKWDRHDENCQSRFSLSYSDEESMGFFSENGGSVTVNGAFQ